jgi:hypothetical protein
MATSPVPLWAQEMSPTIGSLKVMRIQLGWSPVLRHCGVCGRLLARGPTRFRDRGERLHLWCLGRRRGG